MSIVLSILQLKLAEYEESLSKSIQLHKEGKLEDVTHLLHRDNLEPKIRDIKKAIEILERHGNW